MAAGSDVAELYNSGDNLSPGDIVAVSEPLNSVTLADINDTDKPLGIVSTEPGLILGGGPDTSEGPGVYPIALAGRVPLKISLENGPIKKGDYLALSSTPGVAAKATKSGNVVAQALENYSSLVG
jgi:hypothetical protein